MTFDGELDLFGAPVARPPSPVEWSHFGGPGDESYSSTITTEDLQAEVVASEDPLGRGEWTWEVDARARQGDDVDYHEQGTAWTAEEARVAAEDALATIAEAQAATVVPVPEPAGGGLPWQRRR